MSGWPLLYMGLISVLGLVGAIGIDYYLAMPAFRQRLEAACCRRSPVSAPSSGETPNVAEDDDVAAERERVATQLAPGGAIEDVILLDGLRKVYSPAHRGARPKVAVTGLTYGVPVGQVFAFLGINGAGKTTTLSMLSGDTLPTRCVAVCVMRACVLARVWAVFRL